MLSGSALARSGHLRKCLIPAFFLRLLLYFLSHHLSSLWVLVCILIQSSCPGLACVQGTSQKCVLSCLMF